ncbi:MAG: hypothetical protein F6K39_46495, partial [Okeania sp. SIO3B3]|nr:hypothetical protein [Okeania sp. SIO3B3]
MSLEQQAKAQLEFVYGAEVAGPLFERLMAHLAEFQQKHPNLAKPISPSERVTEADAILITYGDQIQELDKP